MSPGQLTRAIGDALHDRLEIEADLCQFALHGANGAQNRHVHGRATVHDASIGEGLDH